MVNVVARDLQSDWYFVRQTGNVLREGWIQDPYLSFDGTVEQGTAAGFVSSPSLNLYLQPDTDNAVVRVLDQNTEVIVSGQDTTGTWYFIQRPDGAFDWAPARDITLTEGNPAGIPIWYTVPSERVGNGGGPSAPVFDGTTLRETNVLTGVYGPGEPTVENTLAAYEQVAVIAYSNVGQGYYLVQMDTGPLAWILAADLTVNGQVPEV